ncbi:MAG TPA: dTDP-4-dehydrorhamnose 3,5-epimerase [Acidimicrobiales bacterium]|nr:dTDP-4-dehydrorhamnose 3,5-epimerase [Acidimicrobiales bacterium]
MADIHGVVVRDLAGHGDERGVFVEHYRAEWIPDGPQMIQGNVVSRAANSVVGLHFHRKQSDWWYVVAGTARLVLHDLRPTSPTHGVTWTRDVTAPKEHVGVYVPPGVAHGFAALTDMTLTYLVSGYYDVEDELGVAWDDPALGIDWGISGAPILSGRDRSNPLAADAPPTTV